MSFSQGRHLKAHLATHADFGERAVYPCDGAGSCGRFYLTKKGLDQHREAEQRSGAERIRWIGQSWTWLIQALIIL